MRTRPMFLFALFVVLCSAETLSAQQNQALAPANAATSPVPRLIKFSGTLLDEQAQPMKSPVGVTFALYAQQSGSAALWMETQNVETDEKGNYTVLLGANSANGVPVELFNAGEARWLGVQPESQPEQPRILLVSVPYALKAGDAQTLGGLPPTAFLQTPNAGSAVVLPTSSAATPAPAIAPAVIAGIPVTTLTPAALVSGTVPVADGASDITNSHITDNGTTVSVGEPLQLPSPGKASSVNTAFPSQPLDFVASVFNGTAAIPQHFRWQAEGVNAGTATASGKLSLQFSSTGALAETGLSISNTGLITFVKGQTLPVVTGNETVTGNISATQLISTVPTGTAPLAVTSTTLVKNLNANLLGGLSSSGFAQLAVANAFTKSQSVTGNISATGQLISTVPKGTAPLSVISTTQVPNLNASLLGGLPAGAFAVLGAPNVFTANQQINGSLSILSGAAAFGINAPANSGSGGTRAIDALGGNADLFTNISAPGGAGLVATGGAGSGSSAIAAGSGGSGVIGTGGPGLFGGLGVIGTGGLGSPGGSGGSGVQGQGGSCSFSDCSSGAGGVFSGGAGGAVGGDGIDVSAGTSGIAGKFAGELRVATSTAGGTEASFGGFGDFAIDAPGVVGGRFVVKDSSGFVGIGTNAPDNRLTVNGSADKPGGGSWATFSDARLKNLQGDFHSGLAEVLKLNPVRYRYNKQNALGIKDQEEHVGFVAQEVEKVIPEAVSRDDQGYLLLNNDPILWTMLNAIKEQQREIERQRDRIQKLSRQVRALSKVRQAMQ